MAQYTEPCRCGQPADYVCESTKVGEARTGPDGVTIQPYLRYFVCADCIRGEITGPTPPRRATPLPHEAARIRAEERAARNELLGRVQVERLGDWGRREAG